MFVPKAAGRKKFSFISNMQDVYASRSLNGVHSAYAIRLNKDDDWVRYDVYVPEEDYYTAHLRYAVFPSFLTVYMVTRIFDFALHADQSLVRELNVYAQGEK